MSNASHPKWYFHPNEKYTKCSDKNVDDDGVFNSMCDGISFMFQMKKLLSFNSKFVKYAVAMTLMMLQNDLVFATQVMAFAAYIYLYRYDFFESMLTTGNENGSQRERVWERNRFVCILHEAY